MQIDFASGMTPENVAGGIVKALEKNKTEAVLGSDAKWMLRIQRLFPGLVDRLLARKVRQLYQKTNQMDVGGPKSRAFIQGPKLYEPPRISEQTSTIVRGRKLS